MSWLFAKKAAVALAVMGLWLTVVGATGRQQQAAPPPVEAVRARTLLLTLEPAQTQIHWTLPATLHTVHGTFRVKRGEIRLDLTRGRASGEIVVDATSGQSGNSGRDSKMHREVLESARYSDIIFRPESAVGTINAQGPCSVQIRGIFTLHGQDHEISVPVQADFDGDRWKAEAAFAVPYVKWGLKNPSTFFLKVKQEVEIQIEAAGQLHAAEAETKSAQTPANNSK